MTSYTDEIDTYVRGHVVRVCRDKCIDEGLYGKALEICIQECIKTVKGQKDADRES